MAQGRATSTSTHAEQRSAPPRTGPPVLVLAIGVACVAAGAALVPMDGIAVHALGYVAGSLVPIVVVGLFRRFDLSRRRSPHYRPVGLVRPAMVVLVVAALVLAGLHVWPIATELAS